MSYVEYCDKHGQYKGDYCGECIDDLYSENTRLREALRIISTSDSYRLSQSIANDALEGK